MLSTYIVLLCLSPLMQNFCPVFFESNLPKLLYRAKSLRHALTAAASSVSSITFGKPILKKESGVKMLQQTYLRSGKTRKSRIKLLVIRVTLRKLKMEKWRSEFSKTVFLLLPR